jgi:hypothetical protein
LDFLASCNQSVGFLLGSLPDVLIFASSQVKLWVHLGSFQSVPWRSPEGSLSAWQGCVWKCISIETTMIAYDFSILGFWWIVMSRNYILDRLGSASHLVHGLSMDYQPRIWFVGCTSKWTPNILCCLGSPQN